MQSLLTISQRASLKLLMTSVDMQNSAASIQDKKPNQG
jgi:hypothetical protein